MKERTKNSRLEKVVHEEVVSEKPCHRRPEKASRREEEREKYEGCNK